MHANQLHAYCTMGIKQCSLVFLIALLIAFSPSPATSSELAPASSELPSTTAEVAPTTTELVPPANDHPEVAPTTTELVPPTNDHRELGPTTSELPHSTSQLGPAAGAVPNNGGVIERITKQQILATIPPAAFASQLFITSAAGKFHGYFLRRATVPGAGGYGNDFCYIQIQGPAGESVWESECAPVSNANACTLVFSDAGLEVFDGSNSAWDPDIPDTDQPLETMVLLDIGDMQIRDKEGELAWKASDSPMINQECGAPGSPGLGNAHAPFAHPIGAGRTVFGQPVANHGAGTHHAGLLPVGADVNGAAGGVGDEEEQGGAGGGFGGLNKAEPLVDNNPFDSGASRKAAIFHGMKIGLLGWFLVL